MSVRLTNAIRDSIVIDLLKHRFRNDLEKLRLEYIDLAHELYEDLYSQDDKELLYAAPAGWYPKTSSLRVTFGEDYTCLPFNGNLQVCLNVYYYGRRSTKAKWQEHYTRLVQSVDNGDDIWKRVAYKHHQSTVKTYNASTDLAGKFFVLKSKAKDLENKISAASDVAYGVLNSVTTTKRLKEVWPEVESFVSKHEVVSGKVPAIVTDQLNLMFNLP